MRRYVGDADAISVHVVMKYGCGLRWVSVGQTGGP